MWRRILQNAKKFRRRKFELWMNKNSLYKDLLPIYCVLQSNFMFLGHLHFISFHLYWYNMDCIFFFKNIHLFLCWCFNTVVAMIHLSIYLVETIKYSKNQSTSERKSIFAFNTGKKLTVFCLIRRTLCIFLVTFDATQLVLRSWLVRMRHACAKRAIKLTHA